MNTDALLIMIDFVSSSTTYEEMKKRMSNIKSPPSREVRIEELNESQRIHELAHASVYRKYGINVKFFLEGEYPYTQPDDADIDKFMENHSKTDLINIYKDAIHAPAINGTELTGSDKIMWKIFNAEIKSRDELIAYRIKEALS